MISHLLFFLTASVYTCHAKPPVSTPPTIVPRQETPYCESLAHGVNGSCWDVLPPNAGMTSWLNDWNKTTTHCESGEMWANCFMRLAALHSNFTDPIRCDLIGTDVCPTPSTLDVTANANVNISEILEWDYGVASIWALQTYMTELYQYIESDEGREIVYNGFAGQAVPRSAKTILMSILAEIGDPVATNLSTLLTSPGSIGMSSFIIPTATLAPQIVGQTVGYLLQHTMTDWASGAFRTLSAGGNLISLIGD